jgi:4-hydroxy 2-oxovalerate aldolase
MSNVSRYVYWKNDEKYYSIKKIYTSNLKDSAERDDYVVSYQRVIKCGWDNMENSTILLLRLLDEFAIESIGIAGFDGYEYNKQSYKNYAQQNLELEGAFKNASLVNKELMEMLQDYVYTRKNKARITFVTCSRFDKIGDEI